MTLELTDIENITLTPKAITAVQDLLAKRNLTNYALRVFISGGGCSGFQYGMSLEQNIRPEDHIIEFEGIKVVIDEISIEYLRGSTIDFVDDVNDCGFKIENPNQISGCGCGNQKTNERGTSGCSCC